MLFNLPALIGGGPSFTLSSIGYTDQFDTLGGEFFQINGSNITGITDVQVGGVSCPYFLVPADTIIWCRAPANTPGVKDVTVIGATGSQTLTNAVEVWDPTVETSCITLNERGDYKNLIDQASGTYTGWVARKGTATWLPDAGNDGIYSPRDDRALEPRCNTSESRHLTTATTLFSFGPGASAGALAVGFNTPTAPAADANVFTDAEQLVSHASIATEFATSFSDAGFGATIYDGAWKKAYAACPANSQNLGLVKYNATQMYVSANNDAWSAPTGISDGPIDIVLGLATLYNGGTPLGNSSFRFVAGFDTDIDDTIKGKLQKWYAFRHGGNRQNLSTMNSNGEIHYVTPDVLPSTISGTTRIVIYGKGLNVGTLAVYILTDAAIYGIGDVAILSDNAISVAVPTTFTGKATIIVFGIGLHAQLVDAVEFFNPFDTAVRVHWPDFSRTLSGGSPETVTTVQDTIGGADMTVPGFSSGNDPRFFNNDIRFNGRDTLGGFPGENRNIGHAAPGVPIAAPATLYQWLSPHAINNASPHAIYALQADGTDTNGFSMYWYEPNPGFVVTSVSGTGASGAQLGQTGVVAARYSGATNTSYAGFNDWLTGDTTSAVAKTESSLGVGQYPGEPRTGWRFALRLLFPTDHSYDLMRKVIRWGEGVFGVGACDLDKFPDLVFLYRPGDFTDQYTTDTPATVWWPSGGDLAGYDPAYRLQAINSGGGSTDFTVADDGIPESDATTKMLAPGTNIFTNDILSGGVVTGDTTLIARVRTLSGSIDTDTANLWNNKPFMMDAAGYIGMVAKRTGAPGSYSYFVGMYAYTDGVVATGYAAWVDVTALVDANGEGELTIIGRKAGALIQTSVNGGAFGGDVTMNQAGLGLGTNALRIHGSPYQQTAMRGRAYAAIRRAISNGEAYYLDKRLRF